MKITSLTPAKYYKFILGETRRYCGKCGKLFDLIDAPKDSANRMLSPCCKNMINNEVICKHYVDGTCPYNQVIECGTNCVKYISNE